MAGLTPQAARIMDLWDGGMGMRAIARETGLSRDAVSRCVTYYEAGDEQRRAHKDMAAGTAALNAAIESARAEA